MKCPICQAKLLPVDGELFCLQCGNVIAQAGATDDVEGPSLEETTDPLLQRAIVDALHHDMRFRLPVAVAPPAKPIASFSSMRAVLAPPHPLAAGGVATISRPGAPAAATNAKPIPAANGTAVKEQPRFELSHPEQGASGPMATPLIRTAHLATLNADQLQAAMPPSLPGVDIKYGASAINLLQGDQGTPPSLPLHPISKIHPAFHWGPISVAWLSGAIVFVLFVLVNAGLYGYYANRVFPGVKVGSQSLGGESFEHLHGRLESLAGSPALTLKVDGESFLLPSDIGEPDLDRVEREIRDVGHTTPLPIAGLFWALTSKPLALHYSVNEPNLRHVLDDIASRVGRSPSNAVPLIVGKQAVVVPEKAGVVLDKDAVTAAIQDGYSQKSVVEMTTHRIAPKLLASQYSSDVAAANARLRLQIKLRVKTASYSPSPEQIGTWLAFDEPGKGVVVDGSKVADYISALPGRFDRTAATNALIAAVQSGQSIEYDAITKKNVAAPKLASITKMPSYTYYYCLSGESTADAATVAAGASAVQGMFAGHLQFQASVYGCSFAIRLMGKDAMAGVCSGQAICVRGDDVLIDRTDWDKTTQSDTKALATYRANLAQQAVQKWLGLDYQQLGL